MKHVRPVGVWLAVLVLGPGLAAAQQQITPQREPPGFDITPNGGWRVKARSVAAWRARLLAQRNFAALNAGPAGASPTVVSGALKVPVIMFRYQDSPVSQYARGASLYEATLFGSPTPPNLKPYTLRTFYEQMSNGAFSIQGQATGWVALAGRESTYTGPAGGCVGSNPYGTNCNGLFTVSSFDKMKAGLAEAVVHADSFIDFAQFDNDGPDGIPNSGDDDGVVDAVLFLHPSMDGACVTPTNNHLWSHRSSIFVVTNDNAHNGGKIVVEDYILQSGLGSPSGSVCDSTAIMPIGTAAHELGHILALPDLYDTFGSTEGIGEWGLMASGNYTKPESPARYDAWSLQQMGWNTVVPLTTTGTYRLGPQPTADTSYFVNVQGVNPRSEYFLIENRQAVQSDSAMIRIHCQASGSPAGCGGGLMVWHVDGEKACLINVCGTAVNFGLIHGLVLEEADGRRQLWCEANGCNRGDGGDPFPGTSGNPAFSFGTQPAAITNADSSFVGFAIDSITQLVPNGAMSFRLRFGGLTVVRANDSTAHVQVDAASYNVFRSILDNGSSHTVAVADTQFSTDLRTRFAFQAWSDGGARSHAVTGSDSGGTYTATLAKAHRLNVAVGPGGTVTFSPPADTNGTYVAQGTSVTLTATATAPSVFGRWTGDTTSNNPVLVLPMGRPYNVIAAIDAPLQVVADTAPVAVMGAGYGFLLLATGGSGTYAWDRVSDSLPPGLTLALGGGIVGVPTKTGTFAFTVRVTSGQQQVLHRDSITVTAPTLAAAAVVAQLLSGTSSLSGSDLRYLDLIGNNSGDFDLGDFLAWVRLTGATPSSPTVSAAGAVVRGAVHPATRVVRKGARP